MYIARFVDKFGNRKEKYFAKLPVAQNRIENAKYATESIAKAVRTRKHKDNYGQICSCYGGFNA